jgi:hypothetical protein
MRTGTRHPLSPTRGGRSPGEKIRSLIFSELRSMADSKAGVETAGAAIQSQSRGPCRIPDNHNAARHRNNPASPAVASVLSSFVLSLLSPGADPPAYAEVDATEQPSARQTNRN